MSRSKPTDVTRRAKPMPKGSKSNTGSTRLTGKPNCASWTVDREAERRLARDMAPDTKMSPTPKRTPAGKSAERVADGKGSSSKTNFAFSAEFRLPAKIIKY